MKKTLLVITYALAGISSAKAQILYGTTSAGGYGGGGTINEFRPATNKLTVLQSFETPASQPGGSFMQASDGKLYGTTKKGGSSDKGAIFSFDPLSSTYTKLKDFKGIDGSNPNGALIQARDRKLYGMTYAGGSNDYGVIFCFDPLTLIYTKLMDFSAANGVGPAGSFVQASDGKLYATASGISNDEGINAGVIFSYDPATATYSKLKDFTGIDGSFPLCDLIQGSDGKLYGVTSNGGTDDGGVIFSFDPVSFIYTKLRDFISGDVNLEHFPNGGYPHGSLLQASDGKLYGMTTAGGSSDAGVIFAYDPSSSGYEKLMDFHSTNGQLPWGRLIQAIDKKLYGMTSFGGTTNAGVIFSFELSTSAYTKLKDLNRDSGSNPEGSLMQAKDGRLYGMTSKGGTNNAGVIFSLDPAMSRYTTAKSFASNESGNYVAGSLIRASDKKLYGITAEGGINGKGVIFSFDPMSAAYKKLKDFDGSHGSNPAGSLVEAGDRHLYGITYKGGVNNTGVIFSFDPSSSTLTTLKDFDSANIYGENLTGSYPTSALTLASDLKLYGLTGRGGSSDMGVIFSFDPSQLLFMKLKDFSGLDGSAPGGSLIQARDGKLYGMTSGGGSKRSGVIFSFDPSSLMYTKLYDFEAGRFPSASLVQASDGKLYGITRRGGTSNPGAIIFSFNPSTSEYVKLKEFTGSLGDNPIGSLIQASNGKLWYNKGRWK